MPSEQPADLDDVRASVRGVPVSRTTQLWQPERLKGMLEQTGLEPVADLRLPAIPPGRPQIPLAARRPHG